MYQNSNKINALLQYLYDSVHGLSECANQTNDYYFKAYLKQLEKQRLRFIKEIEYAFKDKMTQYGIRKRTLKEGPLHRSLIEFRMKVNRQSSDILKEELIQCDEILIRKYNDAIDNESNYKIKGLLDKQLTYIYLSLNEMLPRTYTTRIAVC